MSQKLLFNVETFHNTLSDSTSPQYSDPAHNQLFGTAGNLVAQLCLDASSNPSTTVTVTYQYSNTGLESDWKDAGNNGSATAAATTNTPTSSIYTISAIGERGALGRYKITSSKAGATFRLVVCGRE